MDSIAERLVAALADRYRIERELGRGGMATVYLARDLKHDRQVAIKVLKPELGAVLGGERFLNEIRTTANLQHPNLLPLFDSGDAEGLLYYVMPYVEGDTLRERLTAEGQLPVEETIRLVTLMAGALDFAHGRGVVHRDLKPENVLLQAGQPVIADFGIALAVAQAGGERVTETGLSLGTPHYMSPEQAAGTHSVDARSDQYALGATAYEMLTGEPPHTGPTTPAIVARLMTETPRDIRATRPAVPRGVDAAVLRALEKSPADRFPSCGAFAEAMAVGLREPAPATVAPDAANRQPGSPRRRVALIGSVMAILALVSVGILIALRAPSGGPAGSDERSLAVLPFSSVGGDTANSYFAAGIADELSSALARIPGLRLAGRASAARAKEQRSGAPEIGASLNVAAVLDGSVRRSGDRIRVSTELTSTSDGRVLWSQTYERALVDVFAVQDEITREIVAALQVRLAAAGATAGMSTRGGTANLEAYDLYLRALQLYRARGAGLADAERHLVEATTLDPGYARAQALLASVLLVQPYYLPVRPEDVGPRAFAAARQAVAVADSLAEGHVALGHAHSDAGEWTDAERELERAVSLDAQSVDGQFRLGELFYKMGRLRESLVALESAGRLDPLYSIVGAYVGWVKAMLGRAEEGVPAARLAVALEPDNVTNSAWYAKTLAVAGRAEEAAAEARRLLSLTGDPARVGQAAGVLGRSGALDEVRALLRRIEALPEGALDRDLALGHIRLGLGDYGGALNAFETVARTDPRRLVAYGLVSPEFDPLRADPRFAAILRQVNLDAARLGLPDGGRSR